MGDIPHRQQGVILFPQFIHDGGGGQGPRHHHHRYGRVVIAQDSQVAEGEVASADNHHVIAQFAQLEVLRRE